MSGILSNLGQLHFLHTRRNENVKRIVDPLKVKRRVGINNTLLQRKTANFSHIKRTCGGNEICPRGQKVNPFQSGRHEISNMGYKFGGVGL